MDESRVDDVDAVMVETAVEFNVGASRGLLSTAAVDERRFLPNKPIFSILGWIYAYK